MKKILRTLALAAGLVFGSSAHAGIPVIDGANLAQSIQQVLAWAQQYEQMAEQIKHAQEQLSQLENTYQSMTGNRGLGALLANPGLPQYLPDDWQTIYQTASGGGYSGISGTLADIIASEQMSGEIADMLEHIRQRSRDAAATDKATGVHAYSGAKERLSQIQALMGQIDDTSDPKAIAELQARIQVEQAAIQNEATKLQMIAMLQQAEQRLIAEQRQDANMQMLNPNNTEMPGIK